MRGNALVGKPAIEMVTLAEYEHLSCAEREQIAILRVRASAILWHVLWQAGQPGLFDLDGRYVALRREIRSSGWHRWSTASG